MYKSRVYLILLGAITAFVVWDMADLFIGGLGFPRGDWEAYTAPLFILIVLAILLQRGKDKNE